MPKSVLTLGTFDGVHRGHQALVRKVVERARALRVQSVVLAFDMPPRHAGEPRQKPVLLTTWAAKLKMLKSLGVDRVQALVFDRKTASTLPEDFFRDTVLKKYQALEMVVGPRVAFGKNRSGRLPLLKTLGRDQGVRIRVVSSVAGANGVVSSRRIRALLAGGHIETANRLLGHPYSVEGKVIHGDHRGRRLGFPTANIHVGPSKILPPGVFWVQALIGAHLIDGLCNVGVRPTFTPGAHDLHCEVFLFGHSDATGTASLRLYGRKLRVVFLRRIRAEKRFPSPDALRRQIARDLATAKLYRKGHFSI
jgi:riboflavin kinase/FMN adenylyltransferase